MHFRGWFKTPPLLGKTPPARGALYFNPIVKLGLKYTVI